MNPGSMPPGGIVRHLQSIPFFKSFLKLESFSSLLLLFTSALALVWANSPWSEHYFHSIAFPFGLKLGAFTLSTTPQHCINDGLMTVFFFVVGLEIKREFVEGELASLKQAAFPLIAALGGMLVPALIYLMLNQGQETARGWGIPMATDIAFALGVLALLGKRIPNSLKVFLMALAIIDDLGAIMVIALFYSKGVSWLGLAFAGLTLIALILLGRSRLRHPLFYAGLGILLWVLLIRAGIHGTLAGVLLALTIKQSNGTLQKLVQQFHPWTSYLILPLFAFANAGIPIHNDLFQSLGNTASLGIFLGLCLGKPLGIFLACWMALAVGVPALSGGVRLHHLLGAGILGGIGFTMSIFIADLAFVSTEVLNTAKLSIFLASVFSGLAGYLYLRFIRW